MAALDHIIVRVTDALRSAEFYSAVFGFEHEGKAGPFEIIRINEGTTLDLLEAKPRDPQHLAFELSESEFEQVFETIRSKRIPFGGGPIEKDNDGPGMQYGARGNAKSVFVSDPDGHNLEIRFYDKQVPGNKD